jgi:hypothetical protein
MGWLGGGNLLTRRTKLDFSDLKHPLLGATERLLPRVTSAGVSLAVAAVAGPEEFGSYAIVALVLTAHQALADVPLRQIALPLASYHAPSVTLARFRWVAAAFGALAVTLTAFAVAETLDTFYRLLPLGLAPLITAAYLPRLVHRQFNGQWAFITRGQLLASISSAAIALPLLDALGVGVAALQTAIAESIFALFLLRGRMPFSHHSTSDDVASPRFSAYYTGAAANSALGWLQPQLERVVLTLLATNAIVGLYSFASALARAASDAVGSGLVNVLRSHLAASSRVDERSLVQRFMTLSAFVGSAGAAVIILLAAPLTAWFDSAWAPAMRIVPILAVAVVPAVISWCASAVLIHRAEGRALLGPQLAGLVLGALAGLVLSLDLTAGAMVVVLREGVGLILRIKRLPFPLSRSVQTRIASPMLVVSLLAGSVYFYLRHVG